MQAGSALHKRNDNFCEVSTMAKSLMMLVNPAAGRSMSDLNLGTAVSTFALNGYCPTVFYTTAPGTASKIVEENAANYERLVCLGGRRARSPTRSQA